MVEKIKKIPMAKDHFSFQFNFVWGRAFYTIDSTIYLTTPSEGFYHQHVNTRGFIDGILWPGLLWEI